jgi:hypothetical protein
MPDDRVASLNDFFHTKVPGMFGFEITDLSPERAEGRLTVTWRSGHAAVVTGLR